jgi:hypothetical protein
VTLYGQGGSNYQWTGGIQNGVPFIPIGPGISTYILNGIDNCGVLSSDTVNVTVNQAPTVLLNYGFDNFLCSGDTTNIEFISSNFNGGFYTYNWDCPNCPNFISSYNIQPYNGSGYNFQNTNFYIDTIQSFPINNSNQNQSVFLNVSWGDVVTGCSGAIQQEFVILPKTINAGNDQIICEGQTTILSATGSNLFYGWSDGVTNGVSFLPYPYNWTYTVTGYNTLGSCFETDSITITILQSPDINAGSDISVCEGNSVFLNATGSNNITWSNGISNNTSYSPTITQSLIATGTNQNNCQDMDTLIVTVLPNPTINAGTDVSVCEGDSGLISGTGAPILQWSNNLVNGEYYTPNESTVLFISGQDLYGCTGIDSLSITVFTLSDTTVSVSSVGNYTWPTNGQTYTQSGVYSAIIQNQYGCDSTITLNLTISTNSLNEIINSTPISVYPNPNNGSFFVNVPEYLIGHEYHLKSVNGSIVNSGWIKENNNEINVSKSLHFGMYILSIGSENVRLIIENK